MKTTLIRKRINVPHYVEKEYISRWGIDLLIESESQTYKGTVVWLNIHISRADARQEKYKHHRRKMDANSKIYIYCIAENEKASHFLNQGYFVAGKQPRVIDALRKLVGYLISSEGSNSIFSKKNEKHKNNFKFTAWSQ